MKKMKEVDFFHNVEENQIEEESSSDIDGIYQELKSKFDQKRNIVVPRNLEKLTKKLIAEKVNETFPQFLEMVKENINTLKEIQCLQVIVDNQSKISKTTYKEILCHIKRKHNILLLYSAYLEFYL